MWYLAAPTPYGEVIAQATACWNGVIPPAAMMPPTLTAPVSGQRLQRRRDVAGRQQRVPVDPDDDEWLDALIAALSAVGIWPDGLATTVTR